MSLVIISNINKVSEFCHSIQKSNAHKRIVVDSIVTTQTKANFVIYGYVVKAHNIFKLKKTYKVLYLRDAVSACKILFRVVLLRDCAEKIESASIKKGDVLAFLNPRLSRHTALKHSDMGSIFEKQILYGGNNQVEPTIWLYRQVECDDFVTRSLKSAHHLFLEDDEGVFCPTPSKKHCDEDANHIKLAQDADNPIGTRNSIDEVQNIQSSSKNNEATIRGPIDKVLPSSRLSESNQREINKLRQGTQSKYRTDLERESRVSDIQEESFVGNIFREHLKSDDVPSKDKATIFDCSNHTPLLDGLDNSHLLNSFEEGSLGKNSRCKQFMNLTSEQQINQGDDSASLVSINELEVSGKDGTSELSLTQIAEISSLEKNESRSNDSSARNKSLLHNHPLVSREPIVVLKRLKLVPKLLVDSRDVSVQDDVITQSGLDQSRCVQSGDDISKLSSAQNDNSESSGAQSRNVALHDSSQTDFDQPRYSLSDDDTSKSCSIQNDDCDPKVPQSRNVAPQDESQTISNFDLHGYSLSLNGTPSSSLMQNSSDESTNEIFNGATEELKHCPPKDEIIVNRSRQDDKIENSSFPVAPSRNLSGKKSEGCGQLFAKLEEVTTATENCLPRNQYLDTYLENSQLLGAVSQDLSGKESEEHSSLFVASYGEITAEIENCPSRYNKGEGEGELLQFDNPQSVDEVSNPKNEQGDKASNTDEGNIGISPGQKQNARSSEKVRNVKKTDYMKLADIQENSIINTFVIVQRELKEVSCTTSKSTVCLAISVTDESIYPEEMKVFLHTHYKALPDFREKDIVRFEHLHVVSVDGKLQGKVFSGWKVVSFDTSQISEKNGEVDGITCRSRSASSGEVVKRIQELSTWLKNKNVMETKLMTEIFGDAPEGVSKNSCSSDSPQLVCHLKSEGSVLSSATEQRRKSASKSSQIGLFENRIISELLVSSLYSIGYDQLLSLNCEICRIFHLDDSKAVIFVSYGSSSVPMENNFISELEKLKVYEDWLNYLQSAKSADNFLFFFVESQSLSSDYCQLKDGSKLKIIKCETVTKCMNNAAHETVKCTLQINPSMSTNLSPKVVLKRLVVEDVVKIKDDPFTSQSNHRKKDIVEPFSKKLDSKSSPMAKTKKNFQAPNDHKSQVSIKTSSKENTEPNKQIGHKNPVDIAQNSNFEAQTGWCTVPLSQDCNFGLCTQMSQFNNDSQLGDYVRVHNPMKDYIILRVKPYFEDSDIISNYCNNCRSHFPFCSSSSASHNVSCPHCQSKEYLQQPQPVFLMVLDLMQQDTQERVTALLKSPLADDFLDCAIERFIKDSDVREQAMRTFPNLSVSEVSSTENAGSSNSKVKLVVEQVEFLGKSILLVSAFEKS